MILAIDIGNSNVKLGVFDGDALVASFRFASIEGKTADEYGVNVRNYFEAAHLDMSAVDGVVLSSVIPSLNYTFEHMCDYYFGVTPLVVSAKIDCGLPIDYDNPRELGSDRIATSVAAIERYGTPLIVVDFGTATTFNCIDSQGRFAGGMIFPGMRAASDALVSSTAKLPRFEFVVPDEVIGKSTVANMQAGLYYGFVGLVENIVRKIRGEEGFSSARVIATGGFSSFLSAQTDCFDVIDRELSLYGLYCVYKRHIKE